MHILNYFDICFSIFLDVLTIVSCATQFILTWTRKPECCKHRFAIYHKLWCFAKTSQTYSVLKGRPSWFFMIFPSLHFRDWWTLQIKCCLTFHHLEHFAVNMMSTSQVADRSYAFQIQVLNAATYEANTDFRRTVMSVLWHHRFRNGRSAELSLSLSSQTQTNLTICNAGWLRWALLEVRWTVHWTVCATWPVTLRLPATRSEFTAWPWQQVRLRCGGQMSSADALAVY